MSKTKIHMVKTVLEILTSLLENLGSTSYILLPTFWACLALYVAWYFTSAGRLVPLTNKEATLLWKIHKNTALCNAARWSKIKRKNKVVGFQCACGYKHVQKRLVRDKPPPGNLQLQAPSSGSYIPYINSPPQSLQKTVATLQSSMSNSQK
ncbi:MAG: hypothetical protein ACLFU9_03620 [Candidatus Bathyarchaeia archaeon]